MSMRLDSRQNNPVTLTKVPGIFCCLACLAIRVEIMLPRTAFLERQPGKARQ